MASKMPMPTASNPQAVNKTENYSVTSLVTGEDLSKRFGQLKAARTLLDIQWRLNLAYYQGRQYTYYNKNAQRIEELPTSDGEKPRYRVRLKSNQIMPGAQSLLAKMTKTKPVMNATPGSADPRDFRAAQMAEKLLEFWWDDLRMDDKLSQALLWAIIGAAGYWRLTWDDQAGKAMKFTIGPDGQPVTDQNLKALYAQELAKMGIPAEEVTKVFYMGDVRVETLSPFNVFLDPAATDFERSKYCYVISYLDPDEVYSRYKKWITPDSIPSAEDSVLPAMGGNFNNSMKTTCRIITGYFPPNGVQPKGRVVVWAESGKMILEDQDWPFPTHELPIVKFGLLKIPGSPYDSSIIEHAIPLQQELNRTISQIVEYKNLTIKPRVWAPTGSLRTRITNEPGAVYEFTPIAGMKPEIEALPSMPPYVFTHLEDISNRLQAAFYTTEVEGGKLPPNVEAFTAIDLLQEMSSDNIAPAIKLMEKAIGHAGQQLLALAQEHYVEPRLLAIKGQNGSAQVKEFTRADIAGGVTIAVESGSGLPRTRAGRMAQIHELVDKQYISPQQGLKRMGVADLNGPLAAIEADEDAALREHDKLIQQIPLNPTAVRSAMQAIQTPDPTTGVPMNPQTQKPFTSPQEMQEYVHNAGLQPNSFDDHPTHREQHALFMKSAEWDAIPPEIQQDFQTHFDATFQAVMNLPIQGVKGPNVNLQIKSTAGPTATADILNRAGVYKVQPQDLMEPELPSWISEDISPDSPQAQNTDPVAVAKAQQIYAQSGMAQAQQPIDLQQAQQQADQQSQQQAATHEAAQMATHQKAAHAEEKHQQAHQQAHEKHQAALAQVMQTLAHKQQAHAKAQKEKPKPNGGKT